MIVAVLNRVLNGNKILTEVKDCYDFHFYRKWVSEYEFNF